MSLCRRFVHMPMWMPVALCIVGCGQTSSFSPTSPSSTGVRSGAVITGSVSDIALATTSFGSGFTTAATIKPVTVTVVGTSISTVIDGNGVFHLNNVPPGNVQLRFTATGLDATLMLTDVKAGDRIDIKVRVTDTSVRIEAERREHEDETDDEDYEIEGTASALAGTCPNITFTVSGTTVKTNSATQFDDGTCAQVQNTIRVEVQGARQGDGSLLATRVELDD